MGSSSGRRDRRAGPERRLAVRSGDDRAEAQQRGHLIGQPLLGTRQLASQQRIQHATQSIDIGRWPDVAHARIQLLGSHEGDGATESAGINRLEVGNERVLQRRLSRLLCPRVVEFGANHVLALIAESAINSGVREAMLGLAEVSCRRSVCGVR